MFEKWKRGVLFVAEGKLSKREIVRFLNHGQNRNNFAGNCSERGLVNEKGEAIVTD
jgi:hypothetical protein